MSALINIKLLIVTLFLKQFGCFFEVELTDGKPLVPKDNSFINFDNLRVRKVNHSDHVLIGDFEIFVELSNDFEVELLIFKKSGHGYQKTAFHKGPDKFCDYFKDKAMLHEDVIAVSNIPKKGVCPWPTNKYTIDGLILPTDKFPDFFEGDYMYEFRVLRDGRVLNGLQVYLNILKV